MSYRTGPMRTPSNPAMEAFVRFKRDHVDLALFVPA